MNPGLDPTEMNLLEKAKDHWMKHRPKMFKELQRRGQLKQTLTEAAKNTALAWENAEEKLREKNPPPKTENFLETVKYETWVRDTAWEMVREMWILLPSEEDVPELGSPPSQPEATM
jgi:hypothetical protein